MEEHVYIEGSVYINRAETEAALIMFVTDTLVQFVVYRTSIEMPYSASYRTHKEFYYEYPILRFMARKTRPKGYYWVIRNNFKHKEIARWSERFYKWSFNNSKVLLEDNEVKVVSDIIGVDESGS